jgi:autotransporter-associated beta strand protein
MILTDSTAAEVGTSNVNTIASATASFRQFMCYLSTTVSQAITGTKGLIKNGIGELTLSGVCNYTGPTQINQGTLTVTSASTLNGVISGAGSLQKRGVNILTIGGNNTYSGGTFYNSGGTSTYIVFNSSNAFGSGLFTVTGGVGRIDTGGNVTLPNNFQLTSSLQFRTTGANTITVTGNIAGAKDINKTGNGLLDFQGNLTYTGVTLITGGTIRAYKTVGASRAAADFTTATTLTVTFDVPPDAGTQAFRFFQGATSRSYTTINLVNAPGRTGAYNSTNSTLTVT